MLFVIAGGSISSLITGGISRDRAQVSDPFSWKQLTLAYSLVQCGLPYIFPIWKGLSLNAKLKWKIHLLLKWKLRWSIIFLHWVKNWFAWIATVETIFGCNWNTQLLLYSALPWGKRSDQRKIQNLNVSDLNSLFGIELE